MNNQSDHRDSTSLNYIGVEPEQWELIQRIRDSDSFKSWLLEKTIQGTTFFDEMDALSWYIDEETHGSPWQALPWQPNNLGMFLVPVTLLSSAWGLLVGTCHHFTGANFSGQVFLTFRSSRVLPQPYPARLHRHLAYHPYQTLQPQWPGPPLSAGTRY
jgi:hypothetical protein